jgi:hypothetical protein
MTIIPDIRYRTEPELAPALQITGDDPAPGPHVTHSGSFEESIYEKVQAAVPVA